MSLNLCRDTDAGSDASGVDSPESAESTRRDGFVVDGLFVPAVAGDADLIRLLDISATTYCLRKKRGDYLPLILKNPDGSVPTHTQYSGFEIVRWLRGERAELAPVRKFFVSARRRDIAQRKHA